MDPLKKKIIIAFLILAAVGGISLLLLKFVDFDGGKRTEVPQNSYDFYVADFDYDIFGDGEYMELSRELFYTEGATTVMVSEDDLGEYDPIVGFFARYTDTVIRGDYKAYNTFFAKEFIDANGEKGPFTMQQLYNIRLEYLGTREAELDGVRYPAYETSLEYMIRRNNGSFRNDMGSDAARPQRFLVIERDGKLEILSVSTSFLAN